MFLPTKLSLFMASDGTGTKSRATHWAGGQVFGNSFILRPERGSIIPPTRLQPQKLIF